MPAPHARAPWIVIAILVVAGCASPRAPAPVAPPAPPPPTPPALVVDDLPGSAAELEALAAGPSPDRARAALLKLARVHHAAALASDAPAPHDALATAALRRLVARDPAFVRGERLGPTIASVLAGAGAIAEADALARHLACPSRFPYAPGPDGAPPAIAPLPGDRDARAWEAWDRAHPAPIDRPSPKAARPAKAPGVAAPADEPTRYAPIYAECAPDRDLPEGAEARAAAWVAVAEAHLARDAAGGPFAVTRAIEALGRAIAAAAPAPTGPAMRAARRTLGGALARQGRHHAAALALAEAIALCEDAAACAPSERDHAVRGLADALLHVDFEGPPADAPEQPRPDAIDDEVDPVVVGQKLHVAIERAFDPAIVPPARRFAPAVVAALADEWRALGLHDEARITLERLRARWPLHREAPRVIEALARVGLEAARARPPALAVPDLVRALARWDDLVAIAAPRTPWREAQAADVDALAEGARRAREAAPAIAETLAAVADALDAAASATTALPVDDATAASLLGRARAAWAPLAVPGKDGARARAVLAAVAVAEVAWLARTAPAVDAARWEEAARAIDAARDDPAAVDGRLAAARRRVAFADRRVRYEEARFAASRGGMGLAPRRRELRPPLAPPAIEELPAAIGDAVRARDALAEVAAAAGATDERRDALVAAAGLLFAYGHTAPAGRRLAAAVALACRDRDGFATWRLAVEVARAGRDAGELARLAADHADPRTTCAKTPAEQATGRALAGPPR